MLRLPDHILDSCLCQPGAPLSDPERPIGVGADTTRARLASLKAWLTEQQTMLWARRKESLLIWLQGPNCAGKDGTIHNVFSSFSPQGMQVHNFRQPTDAERSAGFLDRYRRALPPTGGVAVFNRTPYEALASDLFEGYCKPADIPPRVTELAAFEDELRERGVRLVKLYLHISHAEQKARLRKRLTEPHRHWKLQPADLESHRQFNRRQAHWNWILGTTHRPESPWYIIPSNQPWQRDMMVASIIARELHHLGMDWPQAPLPFSLEELELA